VHKIEWWREYEHCTQTEHLLYILMYGSPTEGVKDKEEEEEEFIIMFSYFIYIVL
jgi:hypothetical protein